MLSQYMERMGDGFGFVEQVSLSLSLSLSPRLSSSPSFAHNSRRGSDTRKDMGAVVILRVMCCAQHMLAVGD